MENLYVYRYAAHYQKALSRLKKNLLSGRFAKYTQQKKQRIWNRLCRYARQLGIKVKAPIATACLAAGLSFTNADAQTLMQRTGAANALDGISAGTFATPAFADIDNDGDQDAFIGGFDGTIRYYQNTGTATAPVFTIQTGGANPLNGVNVGQASFPAIVDIDNDGDLDAFVGAYDGSTHYFQNTGTVSAPVFTEQTGAANPMNPINVILVARPSFVDIDGDGDYDLFTNVYYGGLLFYRNTGTQSNAIFSYESQGPLVDNSFNRFSNPTFADVDRDGDKDAFVITEFGSVEYYKNTGTVSVPALTLQSDANNPLIALYGQGYAVPAFVNIDGDNDLDVFVGLRDGTIQYYENTTISLPLHLLGFSGSKLSGYNQLSWQTTDESNTRKFELEMSSDGVKFKTIATVNAMGRGSNNYSTTDKTVYSGKVFYRLKVLDADDRFTYSSVIWLNNKQLADVVSIYPNPVRDVLNLNIGSANLINTKAAIYDSKGRLLESVPITANQHQINVQSLLKGIYVIKFADGQSQSFIKK